tara:strand:- start:18294 stop:18950 length:657 start_codon:yes stop_codon:yes gene_type:complete
METNGPLMRSRCVILEMLRMRGYDTSSCDMSISVGDNDNNPKPIKLTRNDENEIQVHYEIMKKTQHKKLFNTDDGLIDMVVKNREPSNKELDLTLVIVLRDKSTPTVVNAINKAMEKYKIFIQVFTIRSLMYNITKHQIVPTHERIDNESSIELLHGKDGTSGLLDSLHIDHEKKLPHILDCDPVAMFIGLRPGEICKITRPSQSAGVHVVFRYCVRS